MRRGGLYLAVIAFLGGILRFSGSGAPPASEPSRHIQHEAKAQDTKPKSSGRKENPSGPQTAFGHALAESVSSYFGCSAALASAPAKDDEAHWNVPPEARANVKFLIALVPDPVHTHLALLFDRTIDSLQQAVPQQGGYSFDRSILPWKRIPASGSDGVAERQSEDEERKTREAFPGLLIFRATAQKQPGQKDGCSSQQPLFVFLVAETPTSGIRANQFQNALRIMREIRAGVPKSTPSENTPLLIVGPSFSGSLDSLHRQIARIPAEQKFSGIFVYSGSVTNAESIRDFSAGFPPAGRQNFPPVHFASFQENDSFSTQQFLRFAFCKGYSPDEIAILSEDDTAYGNVKTSAAGETLKEEPPISCRQDENQPFDSAVNPNEVVHLHFPREISFFRSAYEKELAAKQDAAAKMPGRTSLSLHLEEEGTDDDAVAPYAGPQTALSQEAVMLGVVSELQKHHIKFSILLATNPVDQLFLARYLRNSYPQGRVVVAQPDLLLLSQEDSLLEGVLGLNVFPLVPGQSDLLCDANSPELCSPASDGNSGNAGQKPHQDRLFESSLNVGTFNAMVGLLTVLRTPAWVPPLVKVPDCLRGSCTAEKIPSNAAYAEYAAPCGTDPSGASLSCLQRPLTWLTILGHDGYWPIAALADEKLKSADHRLPIFFSISSNSAASASSTILQVDSPPLVRNSKGERDESNLAHTTPAWNIVYCLCFLALLVHAILSLKGTFLADSEMMAQFASTHDKFGVAVMAVGAFWLSTAFTLVMCARSPLVVWRGTPWLTPVLWAPLPIFAVCILWDIYIRRKRRLIAAILFACISLSTTFQLLLAFDWFDGLPMLWSARYIHFASEVSPVPPFLLLVAAAYWWVWLSLRGMSIVDLRRPRLPAASTLGTKSFRLSDKDGEQIRETAHPVMFAWRVLFVILGICIVSLTILDLHHPLQSLEGYVYDWGYSVALAVTIAVFLGCLVRLTSTWFNYKHVLTGLDRSPLREAFSRMKRLSWKSMWNPGGSTLRETYRVMSRTFENLEKLEPALAGEPASGQVLVSIASTNRAFEAAVATFGMISTFPHSAPAKSPANPDQSPSQEIVPAASATVSSSVERPSALAITSGAAASAGTAARMAKETSSPATEAHAITSEKIIAEKTTKRDLLHTLVQQIETLQKCMADTAGLLIRDVLTPKWLEEREPVVSVDRRIKKDDLSEVQALAEEYSALVYVNFLQSVLLQMRTLVMCAAGMYVFIVCSISIYPFEPHPALQVLAVVLVLVMGVVVGFVYSEMHRDAILSRLTSTTAGELGWDFWLKFVSAGAIPVFSLLAVQFPEIGRFLFSWLEPLLQSAK